MDKIKNKFPTAEEIDSLFRILMKSYGPQGWWPLRSRRIKAGADLRKTIGFNSGGYHPDIYPAHDIDECFEIAAGAVLTQNTNWNNAAAALDNLVSAGIMKADKIKRTETNEIAALIKSSGYYNQKSERLKLIAEEFVNILNLKDSDSARDYLLKLKGIGPETADSIMLYAFNKPFFIIDTYTRRILARISGNSDIEKAPYDKLRRPVEKALCGNVKKMQEFHALFVIHAKKYCKKKESCELCPVRTFCGRMKEDDRISAESVRFE